MQVPKASRAFDGLNCGEPGREMIVGSADTSFRSTYEKGFIFVMKRTGYES